jgi:hypothetical protein
MVVDLMREGVWRRGGGDLTHPAHVTLSFLARVLLRVRTCVSAADAFTESRCNLLPVLVVFQSDAISAESPFKILSLKS